MTDRFIFMKHRDPLLPLRGRADKVVKAVPSQAQVACGNCGATRIFIPRIRVVASPGSFTRIDCYDVRNLENSAPCR